MAENGRHEKIQKKILSQKKISYGMVSSQIYGADSGADCIVACTDAGSGDQRQSFFPVHGKYNTQQ